jgi:hypothetical protein
MSMYYIRTEKNNYDLDIIIDTTDDENFVNTSGLDWILVNSTEIPQKGSYFYDGKIITLDSEDYKIIENIIFESEEPNRIVRDEEYKKLIEEFEKLKEQMILEEENNLENFKEDVLNNLPKPIASPIEGIDSTIENYNIWKDNLSNLEIMVNYYDSGNHTVEDNVITFNPPIEFPGGTIQESVVLPYSMTFEDQHEYLKKHKEYVKELLDRIKDDLQITD